MSDTQVFFSYAPQDEDLRHQLAKHLSILQRRGIIDTWYDRDIEAGSDRQAEIDQQLNQADIILLLVSSDFLASDYCYDVEVKRAMERHAAAEARVIPVILRPVDWQDAPFGELQALPHGGQPISKWNDADEALLEVVKGIRQTLSEIAEAQKAFKANLYRALLKLGYQQQAALFLRAIDTEAVAAFLIHGLPEYGQQWLLNRLVVEYLPLHTVSKVVRIDLSCAARRNDVDACQRELGKRLNLRGKALTPAALSQGVYNWWLTQDVIFVLHHVDFVPEPSVRKLIEEFWLPLTQRVRSAMAGESDRKLLMFLVDYEGIAEQWQLPWVEKLDASWDPGQQPIKAPKLQEFTNQELMNWIVSQFRDLPPVLTQGIDEKVEEILAKSEQGIPELVLQEICTQCGYDWFEELDKWLKY